MPSNDPAGHTHALIFDSLAPGRLSRKAASLISEHRKMGRLACCDISLWEMAMLVEKGRIRIQQNVNSYLKDIISANRLKVFPITPEIAGLSNSDFFNHGDPADRLTGATALSHQIPLLTCDSKLKKVGEITTIW